MFNRLTDSLTERSSDNDFVVRRRHPLVMKLLVVFGVAFVGLYYTAMHTHTLDGKYLFIATLCLAIGAMAWFTIYYSLRNHDLVMVTEFQNALFASAAGLSSRFCVIVKRDGTIVYFDPGFQRIFRSFVHDEVRSIDALFEKEGIQSEVGRSIYTVLEQGTSDKVLCDIPHDGALVRYLLTIDSLQRPRGFWVIRGREFVEPRMERSAQSAEQGNIMSQLFSGMIQQLPVGMYAAGPDGRIYFVNHTLENWLGYGPGELLQRQTPIHDIIYQVAEGRPGDFSMDSFDTEVTFQKKTGALLKCHVTQHALSDHNGQPGGVAGIAYAGNAAADVKKNFESSPLLAHSAAAQLMRSDLQHFIEQSPIAIARLDNDGIIRSCNASFRRLTQIPETGASLAFLELLAESARKDVQARLQALSRGETVDAHSIDIALARDEHATASVFLTRTDTGVDGPEIIAHLIDTTEQKNLEMRFAHSQKMQAVGQLAGGVAHDFNNLLTAMIGFCDLLLMRHPAGDPSFADIMQVKQNANRAANLVRQLLAFSRRQTLQPKMLDITDVLAELSNLIRRLIGENIELKVVHGRDAGMIKADQGQIEQVFINLAVNARDAMQSGGTLTICTSHVTVNRRNPVITRDMIPPAEEDRIVDGDYVLVELIDTGHGIARELIQKIFEPFFSTKEVGSGTGLGLATCYGIVKQTGGYIYVSSRPGEGTKFSLFFKRYIADAAAVAETAESAERAGTDDLTGKGTILLVEDETPVRIFAARALRNKGYTVLEADCGETALEVMEKEGANVNAIVTDVIMPGMNGPAMIEELSKTYPDIKVVFMSGYAEDAFIKSYGTEREFNFLPKPFTLKQLAAKVKEVMAG